MTKQKSESEFTEKLLHQNEIKTNRLTAWSIGALGILYMIVAVLGFFDIYDLADKKVGSMMFIFGAYDVMFALIAFFLKFDFRFLRDLLIGCVIISSGVLFFFYPYVAFFMIFGPIVLSCLYFDRKLVARTSAISWIVVSFILWANTFLEQEGMFVSELHSYQEATIWKNPNQVILYRFIPFTILMVVTFIICFATAKTGRDLIVRNAEESAANAVIKTELNAASSIQRSSLPDPVFTGDRFRINAVMNPAKTVGGDFYDYFYDKGRIAVLIADVSDKGLPAAMFMMKAKNAIRSELSSGKSIEEAVDSVNDFLSSENGENMFITLWVAVIDSVTGEGEYVNCGHNYPFIRHSDGMVTVVENTPNPIIGVFGGIEYPSHSLSLSSGDVLFLYTDGLTDALDKNGEAFGEERLMTLLKGPVELKDPAGYAVAKINEFANGADQFDDMTSLSLTIL